jgi:hypothetical protein
MFAFPYFMNYDAQVVLSSDFSTDKQTTCNIENFTVNFYTGLDPCDRYRDMALLAMAVWHATSPIIYTYYLFRIYNGHALISIQILH